MKVAVKKPGAGTMPGILIVSFILQFRAFWNVSLDATSSVTETATTPLRQLFPFRDQRNPFYWGAVQRCQNGPVHSR